VRQPYVFPDSESPFSSDVPPAVLRERIAAVGADVITDQSGTMVMYMSEDDVDGVLTDPRFVAVAVPTLRLSGVESGPLWDLWQHLMFSKNGDEHRRIRGIVQREFSPKRVATLEPQLRAMADRLADGIAPGEPFDVFGQFAQPYAARITAILLGIPDDDADLAAGWGLDLARAFFPFMSPDSVARAELAAVEVQQYMGALLEERRMRPRDDLLSLLMTPEVRGTLSPEEVRALASNMVFAGLDVTARAVATGVYVLLAHGQFARLANDTSLATTAALEVLRFEPPVPHVPRLAGQDMVCQDVQLRAGQAASVNVGAACRDPRRYPDPDALDITRAPGKPLYFGAGPHYCLGAGLAELGMAIAFDTLAVRFPNLALAGGDGDVRWDYEGFVGVVHLVCVA